MTNDELADAFAALFAELHAKIDAMEDNPRQGAFRALADVAHHTLNKLREKASLGGEISPQSGGGPK